MEILAFAYITVTKVYKMYRNSIQKVYYFKKCILFIIVILCVF